MQAKALNNTIFARHIQTSAIDYQPCVSRVFYATRCPFRCPYCYSMRSLQNAEVLSVTEFFGEIVKSGLVAEAIVLLGGEPLLESSAILLQAVQTAHAEGLKVKMFTTLMVADSVFEKRKDILRLLDAIQVDIKSSVPSDIFGASYNPVQLIKRAKYIANISNITFAIPAYPYANWNKLETIVSQLLDIVPQARFRVHNLVMLKEWLKPHCPCVLEESWNLAHQLYGRLSRMNANVRLDLSPYKQEVDNGESS